MDSMHWSIGRLVGGFMDGGIQLPEIQRRYVWSEEQVRALIDSIYKGYPSGSILLWKTEPLPMTRKASISGGRGGAATDPSYLLLDGQQRLTSLAAVMTGKPIRVRGRRADPKTVEVFFNMDHPERPPASDTADPDPCWNGDEEEHNGANHLLFQLKNKSVEGSDAWIPVTKLFKEGVSSIMVEKGTIPSDPDYDARLARLNKLYNTMGAYVYPVQILDKDSLYEEVTDMFVRLNTQGTRLRKADLALAQVTARWQGAMDILTDAVRECSEKGYDLDEGFMIRCLVSIATGQSRFRNMGRTSVEQLKASWEDTKKGLSYAIEFLKRNARVDTTGVLPSTFLLVPIACLAVKNNYNFSRTMEQKALKWFYEAMIWGRYSRGSVETMLDEDLAAIRAGAGDGPLDAMIEKIRLQSGRLEVKEEDLAGKTVRNPLSCMMYVLARRAGARDWGTGLVVSAEAGRDLSSQRRRIFSWAVLEDALGARHGRQKALQLYSDIANTVFTARPTSRHMEKSPGEYLPGVIDSRGADALSSQCVPSDPSLWTADSYEEFLRARRSAIVRAVNGLVESLDNGDPEPADDSLVIANGETASVEFKSSLLWDHQRGVKNPCLAGVVLRAVAALMNADGGTVYVGVSDNGLIVGIGSDYACLGSKGNWDGWSQAFANAFRRIGAEFSAGVTHEKIVLEGKDVAKISVERGQKPAYLDPFGKAEFYVRVGTTTQPLNPKQASEYIQKRFAP